MVVVRAGLMALCHMRTVNGDFERTMNNKDVLLGFFFSCAGVGNRDAIRFKASLVCSLSACWKVLFFPGGLSWSQAVARVHTQRNACFSVSNGPLLYLAQIPDEV